MAAAKYHDDILMLSPWVGDATSSRDRGSGPRTRSKSRLKAHVLCDNGRAVLPPTIPIDWSAPFQVRGHEGVLARRPSRGAHDAEATHAVDLDEPDCGAVGCGRPVGHAPTGSGRPGKTGGSGGHLVEPVTQS